MRTAIEDLDENPHLRRHWLKRTGAAFIDWFISTSVAWAVMYLLSCISPLNTVILTGLVWYILASLSEGGLGYTPGKKLLSLQVVSFRGLMSMKKAFVRNIPKLLWFVWLPLDTILGMIVEGDPRQRFTDHSSQTCVVSVEG